MADFFKYSAGSTKFNIGADEVNLTASSNISWNYGKFPGYINEVNRLLNGKGYTCRMFNDFIKADYIAQFDDNIQILYWDSPFNPNTGGNDNHTQPVSYFVNQGRILYNCIQTNTYYALRITTETDSAPSSILRNKSHRICHNKRPLTAEDDKHLCKAEILPLFPAKTAPLSYFQNFAEILHFTDPLFAIKVVLLQK